MTRPAQITLTQSSISKSKHSLNGLFRLKNSFSWLINKKISKKITTFIRLSEVQAFVIVSAASFYVAFVINLNAVTK